ncbi:MAG: prealbumin-like fold domain-containing protein, partial [Lachnospiraceae bacterium]|nr:prealbumin-like fold domain-containing protein [Lachnospiraceae bacterium]
VPAGTYYVKEKTASPGYMLCNGQLGDGANASGVHTVNITAGKTATVSCKEPPLNHPFALILQKMDAETKQPTAAGTASLEGALFQIDYYANTDGTATGTPFHTWVFQTDEKGRLDCSDESCLVKDRSDALYRDVDGKIVYPLGTYTVKEIQAPRYYQLAGTMKFADRSEEVEVAEGLKLVIVQGDDGKARIVSGGSTITAENLSINAYDEVYKGKIRVVKYDTDGKTPLAGVRFRLVGDDGSEYEGTSDRNGNVLFENLIPQHYVLTEISTVDGHMLLKENIDITVPLEMTEKEAEEQGTDISKAVWDEAAGAYCFYEITYEVANATKLVIPVAGGTPDWLYVSMVLALVLIGGGMTAFRRSRVKSRN